MRRLILRWRQLAPGARVAAYRILVDGRTVARVSPRRRSLAIPLRTHRRQLSVRVIAVATAAARASASAVLRVFAP